MGEVHGRTEQGRVAVRNVRRDAMESLKAAEKKKEISEDELKTHEAKVQKLTDDTVKECDKLLAAKDKEIMEL